MWTGFIWLRIRFSGEYDKEPAGSIKGREVLDWTSDYWRLKSVCM
jgi:hypothetical protein